MPQFPRPEDFMKQKSVRYNCIRSFLIIAFAGLASWYSWYLLQPTTEMDITAQWVYTTPNKTTVATRYVYFPPFILKLLFRYEVITPDSSLVKIYLDNNGRLTLLDSQVVAVDNSDKIDARHVFDIHPVTVDASLLTKSACYIAFICLFFLILFSLPDFMRQCRYLWFNKGAKSENPKVPPDISSRTLYLQYLLSGLIGLFLIGATGIRIGGKEERESENEIENTQPQKPHFPKKVAEGQNPDSPNVPWPDLPKKH